MSNDGGLAVGSGTSGKGGNIESFPSLSKGSESKQKGMMRKSMGPLVGKGMWKSQTQPM